MFRLLAGIEDGHAKHWASLLGHLGRPLPRDSPSINHRILVRLARMLGPGVVLPFLHREEVDGIERYKDQARRWQTPEAQRVLASILPDEVAHEVETLDAIRSRNTPLSGAMRSLILGSIDGFVSMVALVAGVAGATGADKTVLIAGTAALIAGALSMTTSEYISVKAEQETRKAQSKVEQDAITVAPDTKKRQLVAVYEEKGLTTQEADTVVRRLFQRPQLFLKEVLSDLHGIPDTEEPHPARKGAYAGMSYVLAGLIPLLPFLFLNVWSAILGSILITGTALFIAGVFRALSSFQSFVRSGLEMLLIGMGAAAGTYLIGLVIGSFIS